MWNNGKNTRQLICMVLAFLGTVSLGLFRTLVQNLDQFAGVQLRGFGFVLVRGHQLIRSVREIGGFYMNARDFCYKRFLVYSFPSLQSSNTSFIMKIFIYIFLGNHLQSSTYLSLISKNELGWVFPLQLLFMKILIFLFHELCS